MLILLKVNGIYIACLTWVYQYLMLHSTLKVGYVELCIYCYSQGLADNCVIAKVNGDVWDLDRPLESDCELQLLKFDDPDGLLSSFVASCC